MTTQDFDRALLALEGWRQAGNDSIDAMVCIAHLIFNVAQKEKVGMGEAILKFRAQTGLDSVTEEYPDPRDPKFVKLLQRISDVGAPYAQDLTNGATYCLDLTKQVPDHLAFLLKETEKYAMVGMLGTKKFFREIVPKTLDTHMPRVLL